MGWWVGWKPTLRVAQLAIDGMVGGLETHPTVANR
jgi:hypothetical protein